jgi:hypothetical protein
MNNNYLQLNFIINENKPLGKVIKKYMVIGGIVVPSTASASVSSLALLKSRKKNKKDQNDKSKNKI